MEKKVAVILVNYKDYAQKFLVACRDSLRLQKIPHQVYIVDNASSLESFSYLNKIYPEAIVISRSDGNYCVANNIGAQQAVRDGFGFLVFANMDTIFSLGWLENLVAPLHREDIGLTQSKILLFNHGQVKKINSLGNKLHFLGFGFTDGYNTLDRGDKSEREIVGYASGCSLAIRAELFTKIGGYNEEYYMYHDDIELSAKVRLLGKKILLVGQSEAFHKYEFSRSNKMIYYMERNRGLFIFSFYSSKLLILLWPAFLISEFFIFLAAIFSGWGKEKFKAYVYFLKIKNWRNILVSRQKYPIGKLEPWFLQASSRLEFQEIDGLLLRLANPLMALYFRFVKLFF